MERTPPPAQVMQMLMGTVTSAAVSAIARLGIPDELENGPKNVAELSEALGARPDLLYRLMRATASIGILAETSDGKWEHTPMSDVLRSDAPATLRDVATFFADDWHVRALASLDESVRTGEQAVDRIYGMPAFTYFAKNPEVAENFNRGMTAFSSIESPVIVDAYDFSNIRSLTDIGGGHGLFLATILERYPEISATLFELPQVVQGLAGGPLEQFGGRVNVREGDMFSSIPDGADAYVMKRILHDWPDRECNKILTACRAGVPDSGKLLVVDSVVPTDESFSPAKFMDLMMLLFSGGKERTAEEFHSLFAKSGWRLNRIISTQSPLSIIEGVPI